MVHDSTSASNPLLGPPALPPSSAGLPEGVSMANSATDGGQPPNYGTLPLLRLLQVMLMHNPRVTCSPQREEVV